jgi:DNA-binding CsgD family transcriptional regulator
MIAPCPSQQQPPMFGDAMNIPAWRSPVERPVDHPSIPSAEDKITPDQSWVMGLLELVLSGTDALSTVRYAAVAIDQFGLVLDANPPAEAVFDDSLYIRNRRLLISDPQSRSSLDALIQRLIALPDELPGVQSIVIRRNGKLPIIAKVLTVPAAARNLLGARAILTFVPIEPKARPDASLLSKTFGLTSAEAKLAAALADGTSVKAAAEELNICRQTARNQLKVVFAKTDTPRQGQLVALVSRL